MAELLCVLPQSPAEFH